MSEYIIENDYLTAVINSKGCELTSVKRASDNAEFMWDGNPDAWKRHSPVLFPLIGKYKNNISIFNGKKYSMSQHGFARDMEFSLVNKTETSILMKLTETHETLEKYPFSFELECGFELIDNSIKVIWNVKNTNESDMFFSIGGHPAFVNPDKKGSLAGCSIDFETSSNTVNYQLLDNDGLLKDDVYTLNLSSNDHNLAADNKKHVIVTKDMFDCDAYVFEKCDIHKISLSDNGNTFVTVDFDTPVFGIWSPVKKDVPFICIEPWYGRADRAEFNGELKDREYGNTLSAGNVFAKHYTITFNA